MSDPVTGLPDVVPMAGLPDSVTIWEVGARDGLQNESAVIPTEVKVEFIERLADCGLPIVEATSFVRPEWVPQLADAVDVMARVRRRAGTRYPVLVPNERGLARALDAGVTDIAVFASATETFAQKNLNRTLDTQMQMFLPVIEQAVAAGIQVRGYVSMCFGDPWEGRVPRSQVTRVCRELLEAGCDSLSLGDTIGVATAGQVTALIRRSRVRRCTDRTTRRALPRHLRSGAGEHARGSAIRGDHDRLQRGRTGRMPLCQVRHREPRDRGPRVAVGRARDHQRGGPAAVGRYQQLAGGRTGSAQPESRGEGAVQRLITTGRCRHPMAVRDPSQPRRRPRQRPCSPS